MPCLKILASSWYWLTRFVYSSQLIIPAEHIALQALFAYHIEALVPSSPHGAHTSQVPQKLSGTKDVHFFSVGTLQGRTLIVYMKKKGVCVSFTLNFAIPKL